MAIGKAGASKLSALAARRAELAAAVPEEEDDDPDVVDAAYVADAADEGGFDETFDGDIEKVVVGSYKSAVNVVAQLMRLNEAVGETWDDRDVALRKVKGDQMQKRGARWATALHVHTARTARWMYMHISKKHLSKLVQVNGCPANGDDQPFETRHRLNKRLGKLTYNGGSAQADLVARIVMQRRTKQLIAAPGPNLGGILKRRRDEYESRLKAKVNNMSPAMQTACNLKLAEYFEAQEGPAKKAKRVVLVDGIKQEEARLERSESLAALEAELQRLTDAGEK